MAQACEATQELINITNQLEKGVSLDVDLDNAKLSDVESTRAQLEQNIVTCIIGLGEISGKFGSDFAAMKERTIVEKFVGLFHTNTSEEMRTSRIKKADISSNLQDLLAQSEMIVKILESSEKVLQEQIDAGQANLTKTVGLRESEVEKHLQMQQRVEDLIDKVTSLENIIDNEADPQARTAKETELVQVNAEYNQAKREEQVLLSQCQTLENYVQKNQIHMESLEKSLSAQQVLINKIKTDTSQRVVLYEQYQQTLKISSEQAVATKIDEIGSETDQEVGVGMAQAGHGAANNVMDILEKHNGIMANNAELKEKSRKATDRFMNRFSAQIQKHNSGQYTS